MEAFAIPEATDRLDDAVDGLVDESIDEFSAHALGEDLIDIRRAIDRLEALQLVLRAGPHQTADEKSPRKKCASDVLADEAGAAGEEYALRHAANRSTALREFRATGRR